MVRDLDPSILLRPTRPPRTLASLSRTSSFQSDRSDRCWRAGRRTSLRSHEIGRESNLLRIVRARRRFSIRGGGEEAERRDRTITRGIDETADVHQGSVHSDLAEEFVAGRQERRRRERLVRR